LTPGSDRLGAVDPDDLVAMALDGRTVADAIQRIRE
jgi:hypothetical protein